MFLHKCTVFLFALTYLGHCVTSTPIKSNGELAIQSDARQGLTQIQLTPGPGLPSLKDLGLTIDDLSKDIWAPKNAHSPYIGARSPGIYPRSSTCVPQNSTFNRVPALLCEIFLLQLAETPCIVLPANATCGRTLMCHANVGTEYAYIIGVSRPGVKRPAQSYCSDVSQAIFNIQNTCALNNTHAMVGSDFAWANGDFLVTVDSRVGGPICTNSTST